MIYGSIFQMSPNPPYTPWSSPESSEVRTEHFNCREPLEPIRFLARTADIDYGISFVNRQALAETTPFLIRSKQYYVSGFNQVRALFSSMGPEILSTWTGPLTLHLKGWYEFLSTPRSIFEHIKEGERSKINIINIVIKRRRHLECCSYPFETALGRLLEWGGGKFGSDLKGPFDPPLRDKKFNDDIHSQFEHALRGESWKGGYVDRDNEGGLILKLYEEMKEVDENRRY
ncbi:uncharacterized protein J3D65DRAFT_665601 [Phyllosticta citribraziliensis]|uniref:Uncharacterized protein n=1 Tax=Phyllosticta citribraziliensis TaxID=989973 RepID=A0ABR1M3B3_9PEZI